MFSHVTRLSWWKTEHDETTNEDAALAANEQGLFAVADGVGTVLFSRLWANLLTEHFINLPLMSDDPFEMEWWVRPLQEQYIKQVGDINNLNWSIRKKAQEGSAATLATLRVSGVDATTARAELLVFGDSCILIGNEQSERSLLTFPLQKPEDFDAAPICVPSLTHKLDRNFHRSRLMPSVELHPDDIVILATDAVSKWIVSKGNGSFESARKAFQQVARQASDESWQAFIAGCRQRNEMVDDDSTALIIRFSSQQHAGYEPLGITTAHQMQVREQRLRQLFEAVRVQDKEAIALAYGDGEDYRGVELPLSEEEIRKARTVADALLAVWQIFRSSFNRPDAKERLVRAWERYGLILRDEACATPLVQALESSEILQMSFFQKDQSEVLHPEPVLMQQEQQEKLAHLQQEQKQQRMEIEKAKEDIAARLRQERGQKDRAREEQERLEKEKANDLVKRVVAFIEQAHKCGDDDQAIVMLALELQVTPDDIKLFSGNNRLDLAIKRTKALKEIRQVFKSHITAHSMVEIYEMHAELFENSKSLPDNISQQLTLARNWVAVSQGNNTMKIAEIAQSIEQSPFVESFAYTPSERQRIKAAKELVNKFLYFQEMLRGSDLTPSVIIHRYEPVQNLHSYLTPEEQDRVELAQKLSDAYKKNTDVELLEAYIAIKLYSRYHFTISAEEQTRIEQIYKQTGTNRLVLCKLFVAYLDSTHINAEDFARAYTVYKLFNDLQQSSSSSAQSQPLDRYSLMAHSYKISHFVLNRLVSDYLIMQFIQEQNLDKNESFKIEIQKRANQYEKLLKIRVKDSISKKGLGKILVLTDPYDSYLKTKGLSASDVREICISMARRDALPSYTQSLDTWLKQAGEMMKAIYPRLAIIDRSGTNHDLNASWALKYACWDTVLTQDLLLTKTDIWI